MSDQTTDPTLAPLAIISDSDYKLYADDRYVSVNERSIRRVLAKELDAQRREIERLLTERDEAQRKLAVAVDALDSAHNALDQATYRSVVGADVGTEALNAVRDAIARVRSMT